MFLAVRPFYGWPVMGLCSFLCNRSARETAAVEADAEFDASFCLFHVGLCGSILCSALHLVLFVGALWGSSF